MRIFHLSDLHIGIHLYNYSLKEEQEYLFHEIVEKIIEYKPDALVIAGDIYDKSVPSGEAVHIFNDFITELSKACPNLPVMMISGNHDSGERIDCFRFVLSRHHMYVVGLPPKTPEEFIEKVTLEDEYGKVNFYLLPFVKPSFVRNVFEEEIGSYHEAVAKLIEREEINLQERNVIVSHQFYIGSSDKENHLQEKVEEVPRMESEIVTVGNIDSVSTKVLEPFEYAALGHLHKPMHMGRNTIRYSGTPMPYSVDEAGQDKGILLVELKDKGQEAEITKIPLKPLRTVRKLKGRLDELLMLPSDDYVTVTLTDEKDLDTIDMQDKLRNAFPHLLEIRRQQSLLVNYEEMDDVKMENQNPYDMFCQFFEDIKPEEQAIIKDVINSVWGAN